MARLASSASERRKRGLTVLDGAHLVGSFLDARGPRAEASVHALVVSRSALERPEVASLVKRVPAARVTLMADALFEAISTVDSSTGLLAAVPTPVGAPIPPGADLLLLLEGVQDPGNVGTLLRSAAAAGAAHVALSPGCAFAWSLKTVRAGMGAHFHLNILESADLAGFLAEYRGTSVALAGDARRSIYDVDLRGPVAIVVGNEGAGLSTSVRERAAVAARIPMPGKAESLNAAVAGSLGLFEALRQRDRARETST